MAIVLTSSGPLDRLHAGASRLKGRAATLWRAYPRETIGVGLFGLVAAAAVTTTAIYNGQPKQPQIAPPAPPPMLVKPIAPTEAVKVNAEIPVASGPNPAASPFMFKGNAAARAQALTCLASAVYYEAGNQDENGERAVAQVVLNRVRHPAFPGSICSVVYQGSTRPTGCQFTFTCDGSLNRQPDAEGWRRAMRVAEAALHGTSMGRSAGRRTIMPITSCPIGPRRWPRTPSSARISSTAGPEAGVSRRCSAATISAMNPARRRFAAQHSLRFTSSPGSRARWLRQSATSRARSR